jgi:hypothetical protein
MFNSPLLLFRSVVDPVPAGSALVCQIRFQTWIGIQCLQNRIRFHFNQL